MLPQPAKMRRKSASVAFQLKFPTNIVQHPFGFRETLRFKNMAFCFTRFPSSLPNAFSTIIQRPMNFLPSYARAPLALLESSNSTYANPRDAPESSKTGMRTDFTAHAISPSHSRSCSSVVSNERPRKNKVLPSHPLELAGAAEVDGLAGGLGASGVVGAVAAPGSDSATRPAASFGAAVPGSALAPAAAANTSKSESLSSSDPLIARFCTSKSTSEAPPRLRTRGGASHDGAGPETPLVVKLTK